MLCCGLVRVVCGVYRRLFEFGSWSWKFVFRSCSDIVRKLSSCGRKLGSWMLRWLDFGSFLCYLLLLIYFFW